MKNIVLCFDGTWNTIDAQYPTNVVRTAQLVAARGSAAEQIVYYDSGVGTGEVTVGKRLDTLLGGVFGRGLLENVEHAYRFLILNYTPGDKIFVFGFSRGAFSARSLGGLIRNCGILKKEHVGKVKMAIDHYKSRDPENDPRAEKSKAFRDEYGIAGCAVETHTDRQEKTTGMSTDSRQPITIEYMGIWDTVGALGIPQHLFLASSVNKKYKFHDGALSTVVLSGRHALAIDEERRIFVATPWTNVKKLNDDAMKLDPTIKEPPYAQQWFPGDHCSVGGGGDVEGLSSGALVWVIEGAILRGLKVDEESLAVYRAKSNYRDSICCMKSGKLGISGIVSKEPRKWAEEDDLAALSEATLKRYREAPDNLWEKKAYRPKTIEKIYDKIV